MPPRNTSNSRHAGYYVPEPTNLTASSSSTPLLSSVSEPPPMSGHIDSVDFEQDDQDGDNQPQLTFQQPTEEA